MNMNTNLHGRILHTKLPKTSGLLPLFEAVVNSIHAVEEAEISPENGKIVVEILREKQSSLNYGADNKPGREPVEDIIGFKIIDNGIGFNDINLESFKTLDSEHKADKGCRGVGRLLWLKVFDRISINSFYMAADEQLRRRTFDFTATAGVGKERDEAASISADRETCIHLDGFSKVYREASRKTGEAIAKCLFEHCLWYFVRSGGAPNIILKDGTETICLDQIYEDSMHSLATSETITLKNVIFELTHVKLQSNNTQSHSIAFCAANRLVKEENIRGKVPGLYGRIADENGDFMYSCYVNSPYLDENVRSERTGFDIDDDVTGLFEESQVSFGEIRDAVVERAANHLSDYLHESKRKGRERVEKFASEKAPRYRPILARIPEDMLAVDPNISDKDLDLLLHKQLAEIERQLLADGHDIMIPVNNEAWPDYQKRLSDYLATAEDIKKSDLANYVSHRKVVLDLLGKAIERDKNGKYSREDLIHGLLMPMGVDSSQIRSDNFNLWLLDERLAFHNYLASDKTINSMPITDSKATKEPDICALNVFDNPILVTEGNKLPLASIVVIEIKRPMRNDAKQGEEKDPIEQAIGYLERIRNGIVMTASGRLIPESKDIPGYCYVICDITPTIQSRCKLAGLNLTSDHMGYFGYNPNYKAYVEVISFDRLVNAARERNRAFFDKLGLPTN